MKTALVALATSKHARDVAEYLGTQPAVGNVTGVSDGSAAWETLQAGGVGFVVMDWKLEGVSGPALFNRLRQDGRYAGIPILVVSPLTQKENFTLLKDYPFSGLVDGAFSLKAFAVKWELTLHETQGDPASLPMLYARAMQTRAEAEGLLRESLKLDPQHAGCCLALATILLASEREAEARPLLEQGRYSLKNSARPFLRGVLALSEKQPADAATAFAAALAIDPGFAAAKAGARLAARVRPLFDKSAKEPPPPSLLAAIDVLAAADAKAGQEAARLDLYRDALAVVHDAKAKAILSQNVARLTSGASSKSPRV